MSGKSSLPKQNSTGKKLNHTQRTGCTKRCDFGLSKKLELSSPVRLMKYLGGKVAAAMVRLRSTVAAPPSSKSHHNKDRTKTSVAPVDSQRAEAIHDCIDFINSSSSLPRSNSVAR
ncbi:hypothetical protein CDL12_21684 [Handroanthus impetiginosus]|uniref:Josephin-like protein n=1 Tax=Handroanthus impetiginosus TaxID=429701 RepID=A0A2G9GKK1_9LAMI|nr:hypothetical protein CDL12_21684 [Handroanthus impetiginosus]